MREQIRSTPFLKNDNEFLWFCLTCRESGIPASRRLGERDEVLALDMDNAVSLRLLRFDNEIRDADRKMLAHEVCKMAFGSGDGDSTGGEVTEW